MTTINSKKFNLTLKPVNKEAEKNNLIIKENGAVTFISEDQTFYIYLNNKINSFELDSKIKSFLSGLKYDINIDLDEFKKILNDDNLIQTIIETTIFTLHNMYDLKSNKTENKSVNFLTEDKSLIELFGRSELKMEFVNFARDLQDLPPNIGTSIEIAKRIEEKAKTIKNLRVTILTKKEIEELKMGLLLSVNAGSYVEPRVVVLEYVGDSSKPKTALVGKGITFDSGGYNLKPSNFLDGMKFDMSGAAIMSSTVMALAKAGAKCNITSVAMLTDNRIGGKATLTESVITSMNGKTVEINNTDAEGRLVLADGITYAVRNLKADKVIDAATLTGAIVVALGKWFTGAFTKDDSLWNEVEIASKKSNERLWRQPIIPEHLEAMKISKIADLTNSEPGRSAGSSTAAAFLDSFAEEKPFLHLDIAGTADNGKRGTAIMLKTLFEMLNK